MELHNPYEVATFGKEKSQVEISLHKKIRVEFTLDQILADPNLVSIPMAKRLCLMPQERLGFIYKKYTQKNCKFERTLRKTVDRFNCIPWFMPYFTPNNETESKVCSVQDSEKFLKSSFILDQEEGYKSCPMACQSTTFAIESLEEKLHSHLECNQLVKIVKEGKGKDKFSSYFLHYLFYVLRQGDNLNHYDSLAMTDPCQVLMQEMAIIHIKPAQQRVSVIQQHKRVTFVSQMAAFGEKNI